MTLDAVDVPVKDDRTEMPEINRPSLFIDVLKRIGVCLDSKSVVDLGAGYGSIAIALAESGNSVTAIDAASDRVDALRARAEECGVHLEAVVGNLLSDELPVRDADLALLVGVVEYAGMWSDTDNVEKLQIRVLENAYRSLTPEGTLILCSKNRLWPIFAVRDVHTRLPLVNVLPRRFAEKTAKRMTGGAYRLYIHTPSKWKSLLQAAGFEDIEVFYPYFSYQYPIAITSSPALGDLARIPSPGSQVQVNSVTHGRFWRLKVALMAVAHRFGIPLSQSVIIKAKRE